VSSREYSKAVESETVAQICDLLGGKKFSIIFKYCLKSNFIFHLIVDLKITSPLYKRFLSAVGIADTVSSIREDREQLIKQWLNIEEDPSVVDAEILDHVSDPLHLDSPTRTPVSASILSEPPQFSPTSNNASEINSPVSWHVKDYLLKSTSAIVDAATYSRNGPSIEIVNNFQSTLRNELNVNL
jgi:hypothetical protein